MKILILSLKQKMFFFREIFNEDGTLGGRDVDPETGAQGRPTLHDETGAPVVTTGGATDALAEAASNITANTWV